jgi:AacA4 family aminoglycoside N(6')-acetyltransferase
MYSPVNMVSLRLMTEQDLPILYEWLNRPHIYEWWGGEESRPTFKEVLEQYNPNVLKQESVTPYIAIFENEPIGYAQSYVALGSGGGWWEDESDSGVRGIDQSLANATQLNRGLGTQLVCALVEHLFADPSVTKIQTDPAPENHRAISCYKKAGFILEKEIITPDGPAVYMMQTREVFERIRNALPKLASFK